MRLTPIAAALASIYGPPRLVLYGRYVMYMKRNRLRLIGGEQVAL